MQIAGCAILTISTGLILSSCAWQAGPTDRAHVLSEMTDIAASDSAQCQSSGAALGSKAYIQCRAQLERQRSSR